MRNYREWIDGLKQKSRWEIRPKMNKKDRNEVKGIRVENGINRVEAEKSEETKRSENMQETDLKWPNGKTERMTKSGE